MHSSTSAPLSTFGGGTGSVVGETDTTCVNEGGQYAGKVLCEQVRETTKLQSFVEGGEWVQKHVGASGAHQRVGYT
jgi:hypothetical protein